ncbi:tRNA uracil 4-sulfurtransferase ThiI [Treponema maltophilum]|uniref:tRNA uracil 4-sulfurtransferase ThiI n=1 Tax=Treponema maltophilum TaxID=51160 RepID=UPI003D91500A
MNTCVYLVKLGELTLKGTNIRLFEKALRANIKSYLTKTEAKVSLYANRMYIEAPESFSAQIEYALKHVIGIAGWAKADICEKNIESIKKAVYKKALEAKQNGAASFKLEARRSDKQFPLNSYEICREGASDVYDENLLKVDVHNPDATIYIEVRDRCFVYANPHKANRGLPVGTGGKALLLLSGGIDSPVAGYRMMRRGMSVDCVYFHAYPYTSDEAKKKVEDLAAILAQYGMRLVMHIVSFTEVQMRIKQKGPENWSTMLLRMCMMKAASIIAKETRAACLISGESLGQVASQTIENLRVTESAGSFPLLRPLIGMDKEEIIETAIKIGTYETSILPYEDCCVLFAPQHPVLRAGIKEAHELYENLECGPLIEKAVQEREVKIFTAHPDGDINPDTKL